MYYMTDNPKTFAQISIIIQQRHTIIIEQRLGSL